MVTRCMVSCQTPMPPFSALIWPTACSNTGQLKEFGPLKSFKGQRVDGSSSEAASSRAGALSLPVGYRPPCHLSEIGVSGSLAEAGMESGEWEAATLSR